MTVPIDYRQAGPDFDRFMLDLRETLDLQTTHQAWGVLLGVFETFRRRLTPAETLAFAKALPPLLRATFVQDWNFDGPQAPFADRDALDREVMAYHRDHQLAEPGCIAATAATLWRHADRQRLEAALARLPQGARDFWSDQA
ncbi:DUF2267 domain-containing protein [Pelagerythrobacter sp.]|uniref:DUF2267 domain-containing protein n=1 Tax=Pelagerythrobacter sp. TaxID=2800702 RepID=UPI0035B12775